MMNVGTRPQDTRKVLTQTSPSKGLEQAALPFLPRPTHASKSSKNEVKVVESVPQKISPSKESPTANKTGFTSARKLFQDNTQRVVPLTLPQTVQQDTPIELEDITQEDEEDFWKCAVDMTDNLEKTRTNSTITTSWKMDQGVMNWLTHIGGDSLPRLNMEIKEVTRCLDNKDRLIFALPAGLIRETSPPVDSKKRKENPVVENKYAAKRRRSLPPLLGPEERLGFNVPSIPSDVFQHKPVILIGPHGIGKRHFACSHLRHARIIQQTKDFCELRQPDDHDGYVFCSWILPSKLSNEMVLRMFDLTKKSEFRQKGVNSNGEITVLQDRRPRFFLGTDLMDALGFKHEDHSERADKMMKRIIPLCHILEFNDKMYSDKKLCGLCTKEATQHLEIPMPTSVCDEHHHQYAKYTDLPMQEQQQLLTKFVQDINQKQMK